MLFVVAGGAKRDQVGWQLIAEPRISEMVDVFRQRAAMGALLGVAIHHLVADGAPLIRLQVFLISNAAPRLAEN